MHVCESTTLGQLKEICVNHQKQNKDCETCSVFKFCMYAMTSSCPSAWKFDNSEMEDK